MPIQLNNRSKQTVQALAQAFASDDAARVEEALDDYRSAIMEDVTAQYQDAIDSHDSAILAQRGFRQLTSQETAYYKGVIEALTAPNPRQAFADFTSMPDKMMPTTIFDQILKDIQEQHPLLAAVNVVSVGYVTEWLRNKHTRQLAVWGNPGDAITKEITSAFEVVDVKQGKLSAYVAVSKDMLSLGPTWLDGYIRTVLGEALACGLETGIVDGKGVKGEPVGLDRDIHSGVSINDTTGYPKKVAIPVTDFTPATYGGIVAKLAKDENGHNKTIDFRGDSSGLALICSNTDYLTKVMPATTVQAADGTYRRDLFPLPTAVYPSVAVSDGKAVLALLGEYDVFAGGNRGIEYSDDAKFLEDQRLLKQVMYAFGKAYDNTSAVLLDISGLEPAYLNVKVNGTVTTTTKPSATKPSV